MADSATDQILERLRRLEDEKLIVATLYAYSHSLDYDDRETFAGCFAEDGVFTVRMRLTKPMFNRGAGVVATENGFSISGRDAIADWFDHHPHAPQTWLKHMTINPTVVVEGDTATARSYFIVAKPSDPVAGGLAVLGSSGRYLDHLVRDGACWRIRSRRCEVENL